MDLSSSSTHSSSGVLFSKSIGPEVRNDPKGRCTCVPNVDNAQSGIVVMIYYIPVLVTIPVTALPTPTVRR